MKNTLEINGVPLVMNFGQVTENEQFTFTCAGENNEGKDVKIAYGLILGQRRDGQPLQLEVADAATTDIDDAEDNLVTWPDEADDTGQYPPVGTATKRTIQPGETGRTTFTCTITGKGRVYLYFLIRYVHGPTSIPIQNVVTASLEVV